MKRRHFMPFGADCHDGAGRFCLWAPDARRVDLVLDGESHPMTAGGGGWFAAHVPARPGQDYQYCIDGNLLAPDPAARLQARDADGPSRVVDPESHDWTDQNWRGRPWHEAVLYELHVGAATPEGTFAALAARLADLRDAGVTAIELMPVADFPGRRNWGYDGALLYAPDNRYGAPDDLKRLVDHAHALGLMVILDVVYNHFGPSGNYLPAYASPFFTKRHQTPWGAAIDFSVPAVREFYIHNALYWLEEFHFDGLRLDAVHAIQDDSEPSFLAELADRVRRCFPGRLVHLVLENADNQSSWLDRKGGQPARFTAQWSDDIHHAWHVLLTGETGGYYEDYADQPLRLLGRALAEGFGYQGEWSRHLRAPRGEASRHLPPTAFVAFLQNHDQIGNRALGERLASLARPDELAVARAVLLLSPHIPMLFMGEEWGAATPFLFFADFSGNPDLAAAVREGRRKEFAGFAEFAHENVPDPTDEDTFRRSVLDWGERSAPDHAAILAQTRDLLALRQREIIPFLDSGFLSSRHAVRGQSGLEVIWTFRRGRMRLVLNVGDPPQDFAVLPDEHVLWQTANAVTVEHSIVLPRWNAALLIAAAS